MYNRLVMGNIDISVKKMKYAEQDVNAKAEITKDHAKRKPSSETLNKVKDTIA